MTAKYWIAKHVEDVFRNEPRNIGVIAHVDGAYISQFLGEREDGTFDGRTLRKFEDADAYRQWIDFWRKEIKSGSMEYAIETSKLNFLIQEGGELRGYDDDPPAEICRYLYSALVSGGFNEAFGWKDGDEIQSMALQTDVLEEFERFNLVSTEENLTVRHPIFRQQSVVGARTTHQPDFVQRNGHLSAFETIDFAVKQVNRVTERAGWSAYMFSDIRELHQDLKAYAIVNARKDCLDGSLDYARSMLAAESEIVNWSDENERREFILERVAAADMV